MASSKDDEDKSMAESKAQTPDKKISTQEHREGGSESDPSPPVAGTGRALPQPKKNYPRRFRGNQGKTVHPKKGMPSKELRELTRQHALLEKNLKIEGMPTPQKFRKRRLSVGSSTGRPHEKDSPYKRKRLASFDARKRDHMPKWELMGGDAQDPLNLNGLADSEEGRLLNLKTPESSPLPTPDFRKVVYVKVPPNIKDPLNLDGEHDQEEIDRLLNAQIKKRHRTKKRKAEDPPQEATTSDAVSKLEVPHLKVVKNDTTVEEPQASSSTSTVDVVKPKTEQTTPKKAQTPSAGASRSRSMSMSPERRFKRQLSGSSGKGRPIAPAVPQFKYPEKPKFTQGNYNRYYGYRNVGGIEDPRLPYFDLKWFKGKDVLDIGCNAGHLTLALADQFQPHKILGMDIDGKLIQAARQNIRHILSQRRKDSAKFPRALEMTRGPLEAHPLMGSSDQFPNNILFLQGNYVPGSEEVLNLQKEEYDTVLALSITKWIHLNNGDTGLKLFFRKIFRQLRPGGKLILEPQPWSTYRKRAKLTPELFSNYQSIKLKPEGFKHYLLSIGFVKCEVIGVPVTKAKGFRRPLLLFTKQDLRETASPSSSVNDQDYGNYCQECGSEDKTQCFHPQFTGMRRGPYASYLYDHVNYPSYASSESPLFASRANPSHSFSNSFGSGGFGGVSFFDHSTDSRDMDYGYSSLRASHLSNDTLDQNLDLRIPEEVPGNGGSVHSSGGNGASVRSVESRSSTCTSRSWSSSGSSVSGSCSTSSTPASVGSASSYSPQHSGINGDIAVNNMNGHVNGGDDLSSYEQPGSPVFLDGEPSYQPSESSADEEASGEVLVDQAEAVLHGVPLPGAGINGDSPGPDLAGENGLHQPAIVHPVIENGLDGNDHELNGNIVAEDDNLDNNEINNGDLPVLDNGLGNNYNGAHLDNP